MTTGPEHFRLAGQALQISQGSITPEQSRMWLRAADIHASLARTAALISVETADFDAWRGLFTIAADESIAGHHAAPLVPCDALWPPNSDVRCSLPADHLDGWPDPDKCSPHRSFDMQIEVRWWDVDHPDPARLPIQAPDETTCGAWIDGLSCVLMPHHDGECVPYGPVFTPHEGGQLPARVPPFLAAPASLADGDLGAVTR